MKKDKKQVNNNPMMGWCCPACGRCHSPFKLSCNCPGFNRVTTQSIQSICQHQWTKNCCGPNGSHTGVGNDQVAHYVIFNPKMRSVRYKVKWMKSCWVFTNDGNSFIRFTDNPDVEKEIEVIGNVYESPELLNPLN